MAKWNYFFLVDYTGHFFLSFLLLKQATKIGQAETTSQERALGHKACTLMTEL